MQRRFTALVLAAPLFVACADAPAPEPTPEGLANGLVYGADNRKDYYQLTNAIELQAAQATVAVVEKGDLAATSGGYTLNTYTSFGTAYGLCSTEPYRTQPSSAFCTGFLVGPNLIATAGHCLDASTCATTRFVFGFRMDSATSVRSTFPSDDVYSCAQVVARVETSTNDYAVVRLDRDVVGHTPLKIRRAGKIALNAALFVAGHPAGLPFKLAGGATVKGNSASSYFSANLDSYGGNSGSPVVDPATGTVEGILVRGNTDFVWASSCYKSNTCSDASGCPGYEDATRITNIASYVPEVAGCTSDAACSDGNPCNGVELCQSGACQAGTAVSCDDGDLCTTDKCVAVGGEATCQFAAVSCDDGDLCTADSCDPDQGCVFEELVCEAGEVCDGGLCYAELPGGVFFSEYVEGSSNNKAIELYNAGASAFDFAAQGCTLKMLVNGSTTNTKTLALPSTIAAGATWSLCNSSATTALKSRCSATSGSLNHNGDEVFILSCGGAVVDLLGAPGSSAKYGVDKTLVRKCGITQGSATWDLASWTALPINTFTGIGSHTTACP